MNTKKRFWALYLDTHMKLALYKYVIIIFIIIKEWWPNWHGIKGVSISSSWWGHQMDTFSALLALCAGKSPVTGEFPTQRPVTRSFDAFFDLRLNQHHDPSPRIQREMS